jgi:light-regulated signal transduction histidine kinase (bacteriophytochrome)
MTELERSNRELEQFAYVASHDLQEPLRKVKNFTELLEIKYDGKLDEQADKYIRHITQGASRMQTLITDLLSFSRVATQGKPFETINMARVVKQAIENLELSIKESKAEIIYENLPSVSIDKSQMVQVMQNLLGNAIKFRKTDASPVIRLKAIERKNEWELSVRDNGIGFDMEYADKIFVVFQRLHNREDYPGTGIGLALCKKIIERHGGRIWVDSEPGDGTTFTITLPKTIK